MSIYRHASLADDVKTHDVLKGFLLGQAYRKKGARFILGVTQKLPKMAVFRQIGAYFGSILA